MADSREGSCGAIREPGERVVFVRD
jgi:hypothetical protein